MYFFGVLCYEVYLYSINDSNSSLIISGQNRVSSGRAILYINDKKVDTINLDSHYAYNDNVKLSFGANKVSIKGIDNNVNYETNFTFFGLYNWNLIDYTENGFVKYKYYRQPTFD